MLRKNLKTILISAHLAEPAGFVPCAPFPIDEPEATSMPVQTFNPTDLPQSAANWVVAQRIVGPFAPHAQSVPIEVMSRRLRADAGARTLR